MCSFWRRACSDGLERDLRDAYSLLADPTEADLRPPEGDELALDFLLLLYEE